MKIWFAALALLAACEANKGPGIVDVGGDDPEADEDTEAPVLTCSVISETQIAGEDVLISANATDVDTGVFIVEVWYKQETSTFWESKNLTAVDNAGNYEGEIPGKDVSSAGIFYYCAAQDGAENTAFVPEEGEGDPYHFRISDP